MGIVTSHADFPEVTIIHTRVTVTITATFDIDDRCAEATVKMAVEEAISTLAGPAGGRVIVGYESERVEE